MDAVMSALLNFGVGGVMASAVVYLAWHTTSKTIPGLIGKREDDLHWMREQLEAKRAEYLAAQREQAALFAQALEKQQSAFVAALEKQQSAFDRNESRWAAAVDRLTSEIREIRARLDPRLD